VREHRSEQQVEACAFDLPVAEWKLAGWSAARPLRSVPERERELIETPNDQLDVVPRAPHGFACDRPGVVAMRRFAHARPERHHVRPHGRVLA